METSGDHARDLNSSFVHTRCPSCHKLFAVDRLPATEPAPKFECTNCQAQFRVESPSATDSPLARSFLEAIAEISRSEIDSPRTVAVQAPHAVAVQAPQAVAEEEQIAAEIALGGKPELIQLWKEIIDDYTTEAKHDTFISACLREQCLQYASYKYSRILNEFPNEEIAMRMRKRLIHLASAPLEAKAGARKKKEPAETTSAHNWTRSMTALALLLGAIVFFMGLGIPGMRNISGIGGAMIALTLGLRFFTGRSRH